MSFVTNKSPTRKRQRIKVRGIVQGVGFRPFIYRLAREWNLAGHVFNDSQGVVIEIEGLAVDIDSFREALLASAPPLARVEQISSGEIPLLFEKTFVITPSQETADRQVFISPDVAACPDCLDELLNPGARRYQYPFTNCTNCGPRFTIIQDVPYDRDKTTMRDFKMCPDCQEEYDDPLDRRFHAQPNACPVCGPHVQLIIINGQGSPGAGEDLSDLSTLSTLSNSQYQSIAQLNHRTDSSQSGEEPIEQAANLLVQGEIVAIKGLGGYHLACDAGNETAVSNLRSRKHRDAKPFALMVPDLNIARKICWISEAEAGLLESKERPIVLLQERPNNYIAQSVAPGYDTLGVMLPYTPLHNLLFEALSFVLPEGHLPILVMTSGNMSEEPIAYTDHEAQLRLASITNNFLIHNRVIHMRTDDSVARVVGAQTQLLRRSRGFVPAPIQVKRPFPHPILAVGGHLKNTFCLGYENRAIVSHHIGDLENVETLRSFREGIEHFEQLFDIEPEMVAFDMHPEYLATKYALELTLSCKVVVQHHHAHIASVIAEHGLEGEVIGVAADGTGYGPDGAVWGGEVLVAGLGAFERAAHLRYVPLPGGAQAIKQPWRMAASYLYQGYGDDFLNLDIPFVRALDLSQWKILKQMIDRNLNCPQTSSMGRLFDAVSGLLGIKDEVVYEGQAAIELEMLSIPADKAYPFRIEENPPVIDVQPMIEAIVVDLQRGVSISIIGGRFHLTIAKMLTAVCQKVYSQTGLRRVALSGGVFQNRLLLKQLSGLLAAQNFTVYTNVQVPANDGGLSLGQAAVAAACL